MLHVLEAAVAGTRRHVVDLIDGLAGSGIRQALVYSPSRTDETLQAELPRLAALGVQALPVPMLRRLDLAHDLRSATAVRKIASRLGARVLHLHSSKAGGIGRLAAIALPGVRVVYTPNASPANLSRVYTVIERVLGRLRTDRLIAVSRSEYDELQSLALVPRRKLRHVDSGINVAAVATLAESAESDVNANGERLTVVCVGRLAAQKDPLTLVAAARQLVEEIPQLHVVWVGDGDMREEVDAAVLDAGLSRNWTTTGWVRNPFPWLRRADVFTLLSRYESFGYATLEAMALGRAVVATDVAGSRDLVVHGETGYLVPDGDAGAAARALGSLLRDRATAERMGAAGRERANRFSRSRMAMETAAVYEEMGITPADGRWRWIA